VYSREYFLEQFRGEDTDTLLERYANKDLTEAARTAVETILAERGLGGEKFSQLVLDAKKSSFRQTKGTAECDFCGNSARFSPVHDDGQRFCSQACLRNARLLEVSLDIPEDEILEHAQAIRNGLCPVCRERHPPVEVRTRYIVWSAIIFTRSRTLRAVCCGSCGRKSNAKAIAFDLLFGWWGFPWGVIITPGQVISNLTEMGRTFDPMTPSQGLLQVARLELAAALVKQRRSNKVSS
jgi:hypothetical protein